MKLKFITLISIITLLLTAVCAKAQDKCGENAYWELNGGVLTISGSGEMYDYSKENPAPWSEMSEGLGGIVIESGITKIGSWSFSGLNELNSIIAFPATVEVIGERAFYGCSSLNLIHMPDSVKTIESGAFNGCTSVKRVILSDNLETIGNSAFMNMPLVKSFTIPKSTKTIGDWAFFGNSSLLAVYFEGVPPQSIGRSPFGKLNDGFIAYYPVQYKTEWQNNGIFTSDYMSAYNPADRIAVYVNNREVIFDQQPLIINSRTLVPVRAIFEAMGAVVGWDDSTQTVAAEKDDTIIKIQIGADIMYKNNQIISVDVPAQIIGDRTLVPVRVIGEAFGASVDWNNERREVLITIAE